MADAGVKPGNDQFQSPAVNQDVSVSTVTDDVSDGPANVKYNWFRGVFFQATVVGISAFTAPGLWNAMNSVGAGGQQTPFLIMYVLHFQPLS